MVVCQAFSTGKRIIFHTPAEVNLAVNSNLFYLAGVVARFKLTLLFLFVFFRAAFSYAQTTIVPLHADGIETNEPCIAIHPVYPGQQILGANTSLFFTSADAGFTWQPVKISSTYGFYGDPVTHIDAKGRFYLLHLAKNPKLPWPASFDRIVLDVSDDEGKTWKSIGIGHNPPKMQDKPWIAVDENKSSKFNGNIYVSWTEFDKYGSKSAADSSRIRFGRSSAALDSFSVVTVSDSCGDAADGDNTLEGATCAIGKKGEIYIAWAGKGKIWFDKSLDGGKTWGKDQIIEVQKGSWNTDDISHLMRSNSMPFLKSDNKGRLYLIFGDTRNGDQDVYLKVSKDGGKTWEPTIRLNTDAIGNKREQYMPALTTDAKTGKIYACWYDRRNSEHNLFTDVYLRPLKNGKPGKEFRVTNMPFCPPGKKVFFGDYISVAAARKEVRVAYTLWDHEKLIPTVHVALLTDKIITRYAGSGKPPDIIASQMKDTALLAVHFNVNEAKSCSIEIVRGRQVFYKQLFEELKSGEQEVLLPLSRFQAGVYRVTLSFKGKKIEKELYLEMK